MKLGVSYKAGVGWGRFLSEANQKSVKTTSTVMQSNNILQLCVSTRHVLLHSPMTAISIAETCSC